MWTVKGWLDRFIAIIFGAADQGRARTPMTATKAGAPHMAKAHAVQAWMAVPGTAHVASAHFFANAPVRRS